jgi:predicted nucleic acid-binding protein
VKIVLDTNILRQDFLLNSRKFEMLRDYLSKTDNEIIFPHVVFEETLSLFRRTLTEKYGGLIKATNEYEKALLDEIEIDLPELNIEKHLKSFRRNIETRLGLKKEYIIPLNKEHLPDIVGRAIKKSPPFFENKSEFRDALIWLACLDIADSKDEKAVILISANVKEFSGKDGKLHPMLMDEAKNRKVEVHYFSSLDDFLKTKASKIEFITEEWLKTNIDFKLIEENTIKNIELYKKDKLSEIAKDSNSAFEEILSVIQCTQFWINDFYVYEMADSSIRVEVTLESELEVEFATHDVIDTAYEMDYVYDPIEGEYDFEPVHKKKIIKEAGYDHIYPIAELEIHIIIKDKSILSLELIDWYV